MMKTFIFRYWASYAGDPSILETKKLKAESIDQAKLLAQNYVRSLEAEYDDFELIEVLSVDDYIQAITAI